MPAVSGLRSAYARVGRLVYFGRMIDKIRLHAAGRLPPDYVTNLGDGNPRFFDARCCRFLGIRYDALRPQALATPGDATILAWAEEHGARRTDEECEVWNGYAMKLGWRDEASERLRQRIHEAGLEGKPIDTFFDLYDFDEERDPISGRAWESCGPIVVVLMGVAGSGKTTVGQKLAAALGWNFRDADEFHPPANIAKMATGVPLNDDDRRPWLASIRDYIDACVSQGENAIVTCSALRESYRERLVTGRPEVRLVHLAGDFGLVLNRLSHRVGHFMKADMLESQFATLEPPHHALVVNVAQSPDAIVAEIRATLHL